MMKDMPKACFGWWDDRYILFQCFFLCVCVCVSDGCFFWKRVLRYGKAQCLLITVQLRITMGKAIGKYWTELYIHGVELTSKEQREVVVSIHTYLQITNIAKKFLTGAFERSSFGKLQIMEEKLFLSMTSWANYVPSAGFLATYSVTPGGLLGGLLPPRLALSGRGALRSWWAGWRGTAAGLHRALAALEATSGDSK